MKTLRLLPLLLAFSLIFTACNRDEPDVVTYGYPVVIKIVENHFNYDIDTIYAVCGNPYVFYPLTKDTFLGNFAYNNGAILAFPNHLDSMYLGDIRTILNFYNEAIKISDESANISQKVYFWGTSGSHDFTIRYLSDDSRAWYIYADKPVEISGFHGNTTRGMRFNISFHKGWNILREKSLFNIEDRAMILEYTANNTAGLRWSCH